MNHVPVRTLLKSLAEFRQLDFSADRGIAKVTLDKIEQNYGRKTLEKLTMMASADLSRWCRLDRGQRLRRRLGCLGDMIEMAADSDYSPYRGPKGGVGRKNLRTGKVEYGEFGSKPAKKAKIPAPKFGKIPKAAAVKKPAAGKPAKPVKPAKAPKKPAKSPAAKAKKLASKIASSTPAEAKKIAASMSQSAGKIAEDALPQSKISHWLGLLGNGFMGGYAKSIPEQVLDERVIELADIVGDEMGPVGRAIFGGAVAAVGTITMIGGAAVGFAGGLIAAHAIGGVSGVPGIIAAPALSVGFADAGLKLGKAFTKHGFVPALGITMIAGHSMWEEGKAALDKIKGFWASKDNRQEIVKKVKKAYGPGAGKSLSLFCRSNGISDLVF